MNIDITITDRDTGKPLLTYSNVHCCDDIELVSKEIGLLTQRLAREASQEGVKVRTSESSIKRWAEESGLSKDDPIKVSIIVMDDQRGLTIERRSDVECPSIN